MKLKRSFQYYGARGKKAGLFNFNNDQMESRFNYMPSRALAPPRIQSQGRAIARARDSHITAYMQRAFTELPQDMINRAMGAYERRLEYCLAVHFRFVICTLCVIIILAGIVSALPSQATNRTVVTVSSAGHSQKNGSELVNTVLDSVKNIFGKAIETSADGAPKVSTAVVSSKHN
uniref:Transmembrane protein n=1 Tax=Ditylenchus dipsaci TaxID=166011 RepID=A0A915DRM6_9BILA